MAHQDETEAPARPSLYDRLGGVYNIAPVVDELIDRVMIDPRHSSFAAAQASVRNSFEVIVASGSSGPYSSVASHGASCLRYFALKQVPRRATRM